MTYNWQQRARAAEHLETLDADWQEITTAEREQRVTAYLNDEAAERASAEPIVTAIAGE
jgi:hypothetical protein